MFHHIFIFLQLRLLITKNVKLLLGEFNWQAQDYQSNILPGTRWEDVPESWYCPECGVAKNEYTMIN